jgi:ABC-type glycerol-3-phosphate transport system substrate-binding protein
MPYPNQGAGTRTRRRVVGGGVAAGAALLAACGGPTGAGVPDRPVTLAGKVSVAYRISGVTGQVSDEVTDDFRRRNPAVQVERVAIDGSLTPKIVELFAAGTAPDVYFVFVEITPSYLARKMMLNLEPYARRDARVAQLDDVIPACLDQVRLRGGLYGLPADGGGAVLFFNPALFERAGVQSPGELNETGKWTADAFLDAARKLTKRSGGATEVWGTEGQFVHHSLWLSWVYGWGGQFLNKDGSAIVLDQPAAVEALQWQQDLVLRHAVLPSSTEAAELRQANLGNRRDLFKQGRVAMVTDWTTGVGFGRYREAEATGLRWDVTHMPTGRQGKHSIGLFHVNAAASTTRVPELAWQLIAFYANPENSLKKTIAGITQPYRRSTAGAPEYLRTLPPFYAKSLPKLGDHTRPYPLAVQEEELAKVLDEEITALRERKSAKEVAEAMKRRGDPLLKATF